MNAQEHHGTTARRPPEWRPGSAAHWPDGFLDDAGLDLEPPIGSDVHQARFPGNFAEQAEPGPQEDIGAMSFSALDTAIGTLCGRLNVAHCRLLELIAELERRDPWDALGFLSCAHYLNWRCGIALGPAREKVRTARSLAALPLISQAFRDGRLSYSKVRALTRIATPQDEPVLLEFALGNTASHVERHVRRRCQAAAAADPALLYQSRMCQSYWDDTGMLVVHARMTAEQGAVFRKALDHAARDVGSLDVEQSDETDDQRAALRCDALSRVCEGFLESDGGGGNVADRFMVHIDVPAATLFAQTDAQLATDNLPYLEGDGPPLSLRTLHRLCCDASIAVHLVPASASVSDTASASVGLPRRTRTIPASLRRKVRRRDGGCRFPGCLNTRFVDVHHVVHWAHGGETCLANLVALCRRHHTQVHESGFRIEVEDGSRFRFFAPGDGREIEPAGDGRFRRDSGDAGVVHRAGPAPPKPVPAAEDP